MAILTVGSGEQFQTIASAVAASQDGDTIAIQAGTYVNDFAEISTKITLEGVGGMVDMVATEPIPNGKAILITDTDVTINNFTFSGATVADQNGAGIRYQGGNLTINNSAFFDDQDGILGANDPTGSINIQNSDFYDNGVGGNGYTHGIYIGDIAQLTVTNSLFYGENYGHEIKSRAENTTITNSRIQDESGSTASYEIDLPNGGNDIITNDIIEKSVTSQNPTMISFGEEGNVYASSSLVVSNNTFINDQNAPSNVAVKNTTLVNAKISNDQVYGLSSSQILNGAGTVSGVGYLTTEPTLDHASAVEATGSSASPASSDSQSGDQSSAGPADSGSIPINSNSISVFRFFDTQTGTQFLTTSDAESATILATRPDLTSEGIGFDALSTADASTTQVFRFFDMTTGTHFYTSSTAERDQVEATRADLTYEGVAFDENSSAQPGDLPVYRFFDSTTGTHFYTASAVERASILSSRPDLISEGIAFYAPSAG